MADKKTTDLVPAQDYTIAQSDPNVLAEVLSENIGHSLDRFDFDTIKIPAGGGLQWEVPTLEGEQMQEEITGIVVYWKEARAWWEESFEESGGGTPPDCSSDDTIFGQGRFGPGSDENPSGRCDECPMSQWGSSTKSENGQACKQTRILFLVQPDDMIPMAVVLPPTSIKPIKKYMLRLASKSIPYFGAITKLGLERTENKGGIKYSRVSPSLGELVDPKQLDAVRSYSKAIREQLDTIVMETVTHSKDAIVGDDD